MVLASTAILEVHGMLGMCVNVMMLSVACHIKGSAHHPRLHARAMAV